MPLYLFSHNLHLPHPPQHGRAKVKTSEEVEAAKKKERAEKVRLYRETTDRIYEKVCDMDTTLCYSCNS
jgi:hypothetical protein